MVDIPRDQRPHEMAEVGLNTHSEREQGMLLGKEESLAMSCRCWSTADARNAARLSRGPMRDPKISAPLSRKSSNLCSQHLAGFNDNGERLSERKALTCCNAPPPGPKMKMSSR